MRIPVRTRMAYALSDGPSNWLHLPFKVLDNQYIHHHNQSKPKQIKSARTARRRIWIQTPLIEQAALHFAQSHSRIRLNIQNTHDHIQPKRTKSARAARRRILDSNVSQSTGCTAFCTQSYAFKGSTHPSPFDPNKSSRRRRAQGAFEDSIHPSPFTPKRSSRCAPRAPPNFDSNIS